MSASVELLTRSPSSAQQLHLLSLISALARSSEDAGAELAQARTPAVLLQMVAVEPLPRTQVCAGWLLRQGCLLTHAAVSMVHSELDSGRRPDLRG